LEHSAERIGEGHTGFISMVLGRIRTLSGANYDTSNMSFRRKWSVNDECFNNGTLGYNYLVDYIAKVLDRYLEVASQRLYRTVDVSIWRNILMKCTNIM